VTQTPESRLYEVEKAGQREFSYVLVHFENLKPALDDAPEQFSAGKIAAMLDGELDERAARNVLDGLVEAGYVDKESGGVRLAEYSKNGYTPEKGDEFLEYLNEFTSET
jgi:hypothetical protein